MKHGDGILSWASGKIYSGQWNENKMHGEGKLTDLNGKTRHGIWENGLRINWEERSTRSSGKVSFRNPGSMIVKSR